MNRAVRQTAPISVLEAKNGNELGLFLRKMTWASFWERSSNIPTSGFCFVLYLWIYWHPDLNLSLTNFVSTSFWWQARGEAVCGGDGGRGHEERDAEPGLPTCFQGINSLPSKGLYCHVYHMSHITPRKLTEPYLWEPLPPPPHPFLQAGGGPVC